MQTTTKPPRPTVALIKGRHITASDKRNILDGIDYLRETFAPFIEASPQTVPNYAGQWIKRRGSKKSYSITPTRIGGQNTVRIREVYKNDYGVLRENIQTVTVEVQNKPPLYLPPDNYCAG